MMKADRLMVLENGKNIYMYNPMVCIQWPHLLYTTHTHTLTHTYTPFPENTTISNNDNYQNDF